MHIRERLKACQAAGTAVLATNFYNFETLTAVLKAARAVDAPVLLQLTRSSIDYMGLEQAVRMGRQGLADYGLEGWIHLDHGPSVELAQRCLEAGFDSVMIDASERPFGENVTVTRRVVELARPYGANVEAELGYVAKLGQRQGGGFTTPEEAARFVRETGVDALAVAIGSAHGFYRETPHLDMERLKAIRAATDVVLVLHGSSGIPHPMVREAIAAGISKVNLATEIKDTFMRSLKGVLTASDEIDLRKVFPKAVEPVTALLEEKYRMTGTARRRKYWPENHDPMKPVCLMTIALLGIPAAGSVSAQSLEERKAAVQELRLKDYEPRSVFRIPRTDVRRAKFPVVDMHSHDYAADDAGVAAWVRTLDSCNIRYSSVMHCEWIGAPFEE